MYEKTIAADHKIYEVTLSGAATKVIDLLSVSDRAEYKSYLDNYTFSDPTNRQKYDYKRVVVDGYIVCPGDSMSVGTSQTGAFEPVPAGVQFTSPVAYWLDKTWVIGSGTAYVRIFFS